MSENPYQPPKASPIESAPQKPIRWARICIYSLVVTVVSIAVQVGFAVFRPFGVFDDFAPTTYLRQRMTLVALANLLVVFAGLGTTIIAAMGLIVSRLRRRP